MTARPPARDAHLALLLEVTGTPKPGNVDRRRDLPDLRFEHFLAGAVGALPGLEAAERGLPVGPAFETSVRGMAETVGRNTQFGALLLLVPLVRASAAAVGDGLSPAGASSVVEATTVGDAAAFYRSFDHVDVGIDDPPEDLTDLDVRRGAEAVPSVLDRELTLEDVMALSADRDGVAREWVGGFERTFRTAERLLEREGPVPGRAAGVFLELLAEEPDTFVAKRLGTETARAASDRAAAAVEGEVDPEDLAAAFVAEGINPGTTADLIAAGLYVALRRGLSV